MGEASKISSIGSSGIVISGYFCLSRGTKFSDVFFSISCLGLPPPAAVRTHLLVTGESSSLPTNTLFSANLMCQRATTVCDTRRFVSPSGTDHSAQEEPPALLAAACSHICIIASFMSFWSMPNLYHKGLSGQISVCACVCVLTFTTY